MTECKLNAANEVKKQGIELLGALHVEHVSAVGDYLEAGTAEVVHFAGASVAVLHLVLATDDEGRDVCGASFAQSLPSLLAVEESHFLVQGLPGTPVVYHLP